MSTHRRVIGLPELVADFTPGSPPNTKAQVVAMPQVAREVSLDLRT